MEHIKHLEEIIQKSFAKLKTGGHLFICELHPARQYVGSQAKFESQGELNMLETYVHHTSDYTDPAQQIGFTLIELKEWFDGEKCGNKPRLISFKFKK